MTADTRMRYLDVAKGIAMICIILGHQGSWEVNRLVFTFHVPIFFLITGYFTSAKLPIKEFVLRKARTLLVPYACTCAAIIVIAAALALYRGQEVGPIVQHWVLASCYGAGDTYYEPFFIPCIGALWFLLATFWGSILLRVALQMKKGNRLVFVAMIFAIGYWTARNLFWFPLSIQAGCGSLLFMYVGYLAREIQPVYAQLSKEAKAVGLILALLIWGEFAINFQSFWLVHVNIGRGLWDIIASICGSYLVIVLSDWLDKKCNILGGFFAYLGQYSLLILSIHIIELHLFPWWTVENMLMRIGLVEVVAQCTIVVLKVVFIICAAIVCSKIKWITNLFGIKVKR